MDIHGAGRAGSCFLLFSMFGFKGGTRLIVEMSHNLSLALVSMADRYSTRSGDCLYCKHSNHHFLMIDLDEHDTRGKHFGTKTQTRGWELLDFLSQPDPVSAFSLLQQKHPLSGQDTERLPQSLARVLLRPESTQVPSEAAVQHSPSSLPLYLVTDSCSLP